MPLDPTRLGAAVLYHWPRRCPWPRRRLTQMLGGACDDSTTFAPHRCVLKMDHHCPWVNNCVGHFNHHYFFLFMTFAFLGCFYVGCTIIPLFLQVFPSPHYTSRIRSNNLPFNFCCAQAHRNCPRYHSELVRHQTHLLTYTFRRVLTAAASI